MDGIIPIHKPAGITSHDVVARARKITRERSCGHTGTLDPGATGVLVLLMGRATRLVQFMSDLPKTYEAEIVFGTRTDTGDSEGRQLSFDPALSLPCARVLATLAGFTGEIDQVPPMVSALHHEGRRLYELAREGIVVQRPARKVRVYELSPLGADEWPDPIVSGSRALIRVRCSRGTYIRTLCEDICASLGTVGHMGALLRTEESGYSLAEAITLERLAEAASEGVLESPVLRPPIDGLRHMTGVQLTWAEAERVSHGVAVCPEVSVAPEDGPVKMVRPDESLAAIGVVAYDGGRRVIRPTVVF